MRIVNFQRWVYLCASAGKDSALGGKVLLLLIIHVQASVSYVSI